MIDELLSDDDDDFHHLENHFDHDDLEDHEDEDEDALHHPLLREQPKPREVGKYKAEEKEKEEEEEDEHPVSRATLTERKVEQLPEINPESIKVELTYVVGKEKMSLNALKELREGSVLPISGPPDFPVTIFVQDKPVAIGQLVLVESSPSVQVKHILT